MTVYYVDNAGNDANSGLSTALPWQTLAKVNAFTFTAGDWCLFKSGQTFTGILRPIAVNLGNATYPLVFAYYGAGAKPIIDHGANFVASYIEVPYLRFENIDFTGSTASNYSTVMAVTHDVKWLNCIFRDGLYCGFQAWTASGSEIYNVIVDGCEAHTNVASGIIISSNTGVGGPHDCVVRNCIAHNNGTTDFADHGIYVRYGCTIHDCVCYSNPHGGGIKINSEGIHSVWSPIVYNNYCHDNMIGLYAAHQNANIYNNLVVGNVYNVNMDSDSHDMMLVFNTFANASGMQFRIESNTLLARTVIKNNLIIQDQAVQAKYTYQGTTTGVIANLAAANTVDYNVYYTNANTASNIMSDSSGQKTWTQWLALTGAPDSHSTFLPALPEIAARYTDFHPLLSGNVYQRGIAIVGYSFDYDGLALSIPPTPGAFSALAAAIFSLFDMAARTARPNYELRTYTQSGVLKHRFTDFGELACTIAVNAPGVLRFTLDGLHRCIPDLQNQSHIELWRKDDSMGIDWHRHFGGLYLAQDWSYSGAPMLTLIALEYKWLLQTRVIDWYANTANRTAFVAQPAETVMKTIVNYNAGASATVANGRKREGAITGLTVQANGANGSTQDYYCFGDNLLGTLQKMALLGGGDFDLVKTAAQAFEFRWYTGQMGTDRRSTVIFSLTNGNMSDPTYQLDRSEEKTVAAVWGQGQESARATATRTGVTYDVSANNIEVLVNASDVATAAGLNTRGDAKLAEAQAREQFDFKIVQTPSSQFGLHYYLGDKVTVSNPFTGVSTVQKIIAVTLSLAKDGAETITPQLETPA